MELKTFLHNLQYHTHKVSPSNWSVDWQDAPYPYKLYRDLPYFSLSLELPLSIEIDDTDKQLNKNTMGHFLWYVYGLTQMSQSLSAIETKDELIQSLRRFAPSGGALYPSELYVYLKLNDLPHGVYHYDVAHHQLLQLREGNFDDYVNQALGNRCDLSSCFALIFVSTVFWKNFFKYNNFSYRLQGMDAGVVIGQLLEVAKRFGYESSVYFQFLDRSINHLLGLVDQEESTYAVIALSVEQSNGLSFKSEMQKLVSAEKLRLEIPAIHTNQLQRSKDIKEFPMLVNINEASMMHSTQDFKLFNFPNPNKKSLDGNEVTLPPVKRHSYDLASVCRKRFSPEMDFKMEKPTQIEVASILHEASQAFSYRNDLDGDVLNQNHRVSIYGCFTHIENIADGAYQYDNKSHSLRLIQEGDFRLSLQDALTLDNVNLYQVPLCFHVVGEKNYYHDVLGYRGYRIQQMEAGMLVQRLLLAATAIGMGGHPLLGFDVNACDELYQLGSLSKTTLIQIPTGCYRSRPWLKGALHG